MKRMSNPAALLAAAGLALVALPEWAGAGAFPLHAAPAQPSRPIVLAQAGDAAFRVNQLEEEVRTLNGRIEDLTFQLLQLQEQIRKMQEDNEYRFQQLEEKRGDLGGSRPVARNGGAPGGALPGKLQPSEQDLSAQRSDGDPIARTIEGAAPPKTIDGVEVYQGPPVADALQPRALGTLTFDANGNVVAAAPGAPVDLSRPGGARPGAGGALPGVEPPPGGSAVDAEPMDGGGMASLDSISDPNELYDLGYNYVQAGDYHDAEMTFAAFSERFPQNPRLGEARFWLGESILSQGRYEESAKIFLDAHKRFPDSHMGPQTLLKLGVSLAGMNQRELACATLAEVPKKYPNLSTSVRARVAAEQKSASCKTK